MSGKVIQFDASDPRGQSFLDLQFFIDPVA